MHAYEEKVTNDALYEYGECPFGMTRSAKLFSVLKSWTRMVESGKWRVGENGVEGGTEGFKNADTRMHGADYTLEACFDVGLD